MTDRKGTIALVGSGEFLPAMADVDKLLINRITEAPRVAIVPTASVPDGPDVFERWMRMGVEHFEGLGATAAPVALRDHADADDPSIVARIADSNFVYLSGGKPAYLREALQNTASWRAMVDVVESGGVIAGCSAGAMVLGEKLLSFRQALHPTPALGLVPGIAVIPHFDEIPHLLDGLMERIVDVISGGTVMVVGVEGNTALVVALDGWSVAGRGGVTIFSDKSHVRYVAGEAVKQ